MARLTADSWIPVEFASDAIVRPAVASAIEAVSNHIPMNSTSKVVPRSGSATVAVVSKGSAYGEDAATNDTVTLTACKIGTQFRIAQEDIDDSLANLVSVKQNEFAASYAKFLDNAALGTTAAGNLGTVPFTSVYKAVTTADANAGYTANANYVATAAGAGLTYSKLGSLFGLVETGEFYDPSSLVVMADPSIIGSLRGLVDSQGRPIFLGSQDGALPTLFGVPVKWTKGARTSATATKSPSGNPLVIVANRDYLMVGDRSGVEAMVNTTAAISTDEVLLHMRARKAFALANPFAAAVLEILP